MLGLTLAAGGLGASPGGGLCRGALGGCLHMLAALRLLGREARALCASCWLFCPWGDTERPWGTCAPPPRDRAFHPDHARDRAGLFRHNGLGGARLLTTRPDMNTR